MVEIIQVGYKSLLPSMFFVQFTFKVILNDVTHCIGTNSNF